MNDDILKGNELIADFIGYTLKGRIVESTPKNPNKSNSWDTLVGYSISQAEYHKSWDWLMPVVKKCWNIINTFDYDSEEYFHLTEEIFHTDYSLNEFMDADIESVYRRVVEFIEWYNENYLNE